ncbi:HAMP domain-containing protein [Lonsdalea britannica]|uniref:HAMP domain-containing protein n=1 Tax=Lonsdalea britannica TaxID=1082704 RepID=UPI000A1DDBD9|nr:HAMP domain-containing protein [Lonsdalea britannica]
MHVRRSLTIKQMTVISAVSVTAVCLFIVIQLFHFVHQRRDDYVRQLEHIAYSVRTPLTNAVLQGDVVEADGLLNNLLPVGFLSRAYLVLPGELHTLHANFPSERPLPRWIARTFNLPIEVSIPLYSLPQVPGSTPLAHLVLQADSYRMFQFIVSTFSTLLVTYLLLALILSVGITWCVKHRVVNPLRLIIKELQDVPAESLPDCPLTLPERHSDDELGMLVRSYNRNLRRWKSHRRAGDEVLTDKATLINALSRQREPFCLCVVGLEGEAVRGSDTLPPMLAALRTVIGDSSLLARLDNDEYAVLGAVPATPDLAQAWGHQTLALLREGGLLAGVNVSIGLLAVPDEAAFMQPNAAGQWLAQARLAMEQARGAGGDAALSLVASQLAPHS